MPACTELCNQRFDDEKLKIGAVVSKLTRAEKQCDRCYSIQFIVNPNRAARPRRPPETIQLPAKIAGFAAAREVMPWHGRKIRVSGQRTPKQNAPQPIPARRFSAKQPVTVIFPVFCLEPH